MVSLPASNANTKEAPIAKVPSGPEDGSVEDQKVDSRQVDQAAAYLENADQYEPLTPKEAKWALRKTDWIFLPMVRARLSSCHLHAGIC